MVWAVVPGACVSKTRCVRVAVGGGARTAAVLLPHGYVAAAFLQQQWVMSSGAMYAAYLLFARSEEALSKGKVSPYTFYKASVGFFAGRRWYRGAQRRGHSGLTGLSCEIPRVCCSRVRAACPSTANQTFPST